LSLLVEFFQAINDVWLISLKVLFNILFKIVQNQLIQPKLFPVEKVDQPNPEMPPKEIKIQSSILPSQT